jgi:hypothetical protein
MAKHNKLLILIIFAIFAICINVCQADDSDVDDDSELGSHAFVVSAPLKALRWFKKNQNPDGSWGTKEASTQLTPLVILTFLGHGETPASSEFGETSRKSFIWLHKEASNNNTPDPLITWAICSAYGYTRIPLLEKPAKKQLKLIIDSQQHDGSFKYNGDLLFPAKKYNTVSHCLNLIALKEGYVGGLCNEKNNINVEKGLKWLIKNCFLKNKKGFSLYPGDKKTSPLAISTALFTIISFIPKIPAMRETLVKLYEDVKFNWDKPGLKYPYLTWYSMNKAIYNGYAGHGDEWKTWSKAYSSGLVNHQNKEGYWLHPEAGKMFSEKKDKTIYCTVLSTLMMEIWYAYYLTFNCVSLSPSFRKQILNELKDEASEKNLKEDENEIIILP